MSTLEIRQLLDSRRATSGQHDSAQTIMEALLEHVVALEAELGKHEQPPAW